MYGFSVGALGYEAGHTGARKPDGMGTGGFEIKVFSDRIEEGGCWAVDSGM